MRLITAASLGGNAAAAAAAVIVVRRKGWAAIVRAIRPPVEPPVDYPALARERFADLPGAETVLAGDSQAQNCPAGELFGPVAVRGIGGMTIAQLTGWIDLVLDNPELRRLLLWVGTNDVGLGHPARQIRDDMGAMLERTGRREDVEVVVLSVPPMVGREDAVAEVNAALADIAAEHRAAFVDLTDRLRGYLAADGAHVTSAGYSRLVGAIT